MPKQNYQPEDLPKHIEAILNWITSCRTSYQMDIIIKVMHDLIFERFREVITEYEMQIIKHQLKTAWEDQSLFIIKHYYDGDESKREIPTIGLYLYHEKN